MGEILLISGRILKSVLIFLVILIAFLFLKSSVIYLALDNNRLPVLARIVIYFVLSYSIVLIGIWGVRRINVSNLFEFKKSYLFFGMLCSLLFSMLTFGLTLLSYRHGYILGHLNQVSFHLTAGNVFNNISMGKHNKLNLLVLADACTFQPIIEEIIFRGILISYMVEYQKLAPVLAITLGAGLFMLAHTFNTFNPEILCFGLLAGFLFTKTKSLIPGIAFHMSGNMLIAILNMLTFSFS
ncbi:MAG: CPBP family intramembrane metalloprotease [Lactobacillaceae bacterium]|jgi:membrane protease YdiL (CAAX protease family)|nr:CPBP family intramembrane metalloprotease [Lactobacillaceae bacterium]